MSYRFPIARKLLAFAGRARRSWMDRHQVPANFWLHLLGIPLAFAAVRLGDEAAQRRHLADDVSYEAPYYALHVVGRDRLAVVPGDAGLQLPHHRLAVRGERAVLAPRDRGGEAGPQIAVAVQRISPRHRLKSDRVLNRYRPHALCRKVP